MGHLKLLFIPLTFIVFHSVSQCEIPKEMQILEYRREANPDKFKTWLNSEDKNVQLNALKSLGGIQDTTTIPWMAQKLESPDPEIRTTAAFAIGQTFSNSAEDVLLAALTTEQNMDVKANLLEALGKTGSHKSLDFLDSLIRIGPPEIQGHAVMAAGILAYRGFKSKSLNQTIAKLLTRTYDSQIEWRCLYALYRIGYADNVRIIFNSLMDSDSLTQFFALKALGEIITNRNTFPDTAENQNDVFTEIDTVLQSQIFKERLISLADDANWFVSVESIKLMGMLGDSSFWKIIKKAIRDPHPYVRETAFEAASQLKIPKAEKHLLEIYEKSADWRQRGQALKALARFAPDRVFSLIQSEIQNIDWPENIYHIRALRDIKTPEAKDLLIQLLKVQTITQKTTVLQALEKTPLPKEMLLDLLKLNDLAITTLIAPRFGELKDKNLAAPLIRAYHKFKAPKGVEPMVAIINSLGEIGGEESIRFLKQESRHSLAPIRRAALQNITGEMPKRPDTANKILTRYQFPDVRLSGKPVIQFTTTKGEITVELYPKKAPVTVANFLYLIKSEFYENIFFHRVVPGFVIQAGDPRGDGWGGPGYAIPCEYNELRYERGIMGMAHAGKDTGGSQFFITHTPQPHLNGRYTAFGKVISGMDVVDQIEIFDQINKIMILP